MEIPEKLHGCCECSTNLLANHVNLNQLDGLTTSLAALAYASLCDACAAGICTQQRETNLKLIVLRITRSHYLSQNSESR